MEEAINLKELAKKRFLVDVVQSVSRKHRGTGLILVLDQESSDILTSLMSIPELTENGVFIVENIERKRKDYPKYPSIYFLTPTDSNIDFIEEDFGEGEKKYASLHLFFTKQIPDSTFAYLKTKRCVKRVKSLMEVNLNMSMVNDFIFAPKKGSDNLDEQVETIFSTISQLRGLESAELFRLKNPLYKDASYIQKALDKRVSTLIKQHDGEGKNSLKVFIFERNVDLITPLIHDFHYESLITDIMSNESYVKDENDVVYSKYRHAFIKDCILGIGDDFEKFLNENPVAKLQRNNKSEKVRTDKLGTVVRGITEYNEVIKYYEDHIATVGKLNKLIDQNGYKDLAEIECTIATGVDEYGESIDTKKRLEVASGVLDQLGRDKLNQARLLMIMQGSLYKDSSSKVNSLSDYNLRKKFDDYSQLVSKYGKYWPEKEKDNLKKITKVKYNENEASLQRYICKTEYLIKEAIANNNTNQFDVLKYGNTGFFSKAQNTFFKGKLTNIGKKKGSKKTYVLVYFVGGISFTEVQYLKNLEQVFGEGTIVVVGSPRLLTPNSFIESYLGTSASKSGKRIDF